MFVADIVLYDYNRAATLLFGADATTKIGVIRLAALICSFRLLFMTSNRTINQVAFPLSFSRYILAQSLMWLMLITKAIGKYPMNGYSVVKEQRIFQMKDPSLYLPLSEGSDNR